MGKIRAWIADELNQKILAGAAVVLTGLWALVTYFFPSPSPTPETPRESAINQTVTGSGTTIAATEGSHVYITNTKGISPEVFERLSEELGVTKSALKSFFKILEYEQVPPEDLDASLREIAKRYKELVEKLSRFSSGSPAILELKKKAKAALEQGDFDRAEELLKRAQEEDLDAIEAQQQTIDKRRLSAAETAAQLGNLKMAQLAYVEAAEHFKKAVELVPSTALETKATYLDLWGKENVHAGKFNDAQTPLKDALTLREQILGPEHPDTVISLQRLAFVYGLQGRYNDAVPLYLNRPGF